MRLAPSMDIYMNVVTSLKSVDDICICNIYDNIQKTKKKRKRKLEKWRRKPSISAWENFLITTKIFLPENYLPREWSWVSPPCPTCYRAWHSKSFLPFSRFGHEQKNAKIASESSLLVTYQCSYCDGRENHPRRGFSTEATASYSHWRGLLDLMSKEQVLSAVVYSYVLCHDENSM